MTHVTIRELRNRGGEVMDRVSAGERLIVTRDGRPVAELLPVRSVPVPADALLARWAHLPPVNLQALREDLDAVVDPTL